MVVEVINTRRISQEDPKGDCRSFGNNCFPSSQSRKISIGIMADSATRKQPEAMNGTQVPGPNAKMKNSVKENYAEARPHDRSVGDLNKGKQAEALEYVSSPCISSRPMCWETLTKETELPAKASSLPSTKGQNRKPSGMKGATIENAVHFFSNQDIPSGNSNEKSKGLEGKCKAGNGGNSEREDDFTFATAHDKVLTGDMTNEKRTETLRVKLWEILGNVSSPKTQPSDSQARDVGPNTTKPVQSFEKDDAALKPRQLSDAIETDSESIDHTMKRPITRSLARKKTSTRKPTGKSRAGPSSTCKHKFEKNNSPCRGRSSGKGNITADGGLSVSGKKVQQKRISVKPRKILFPENKNMDNIPQETHRSETSAFAAKRSSADNQRSFSGFPAQKKRDFTNSKEQNQEGDSPISRGRNSQQSVGTPKKDQQGANTSPPILADRDHPEVTAYLFQSPTMKMNTPISSSSPCLSPKKKQENQDAGSPVDAQRILSASNVRSFRSLQKSKRNSLATTDQVESLDDAADPKDSPPTKLPSPREKDVETCLSESLSGDEDFDGSEDDSPIEVNLHCKPPRAKKQKDAEATFSESSDANEDSDSSRESSPHIDGKKVEERCLLKFKGTDIPIPEAAAAKRSRFTLSPNKRNRVQKQKNVDEFSPPMPSRKGPAGSDWMPAPEPSISTQEHDSQRITMLFAMALKNFKIKMALATKRKSSEILTSVSEEIHQQLEEMESEIHTDLGKLTSVSRSKRKRLEGKFQEQQEQLKLIHEKFKTDIHQHIQESKSMLERLEVQQNELKGAMKNQKATHQKLLLQAEEAIQTKLSDAERRITGVQKSAKVKMLLVYRAIAECLNEEGLS